MDLVDHLLSDLISTTHSYKQVVERENRLTSDLSLVQSQLFPLRKENARLARENHDLHLDNVKLNEDNILEVETLAKRIRLLNDEMTELKLLNKVCDDELRAKNLIIDKLRDVSASSSASLYLSLSLAFSLCQFTLYCLCRPMRAFLIQLKSLATSFTAESRSVHVCNILPMTPVQIPNKLGSKSRMMLLIKTFLMRKTPPLP